MRIAVFGDVHANEPALGAVLEAIDRLAPAPDLLVCLGDLVGYHAEPAVCVRRVREIADVVVAGNHDRDLVREASPGTNGLARRLLSWSREQLGDEELGYLASLPGCVSNADFTAAHGSFLSEVFVTGYVTSTMLEKNLQAIAGRATWPPMAFCGHTHVPLAGWWDGVAFGESRLDRPFHWPAAARAVLINPGSVGQPRDGDPRAAFAVVDLEARSCQVRRVAYDVERTCAALRQAGLPDELAQRLRAGT
jgi:diadenosine tetraphosphatase ApaH/serine/threonine PP2A family protein phosphatase